MKSLISKISLLTFSLFFSTFCYSQYKHSIGLKTSTFRRNSLQLEQTFTINSNLTIFANFTIGRESYGSRCLGEVPGDTILNEYRFNSNSQFYSGKIGLNKTLSFFPNNYFYIGSALGIGYEEHHTEDTHWVNYYDENGTYFESETGLSMTTNYTVNRTFNSGIFLQFYLTLGMNLPLTKRLSFNCEINAIILHSENTGSLVTELSFVPSISGGLRYSFGEKSK
ncbi:MAG: hypothetical protein HRT58_20590 [Crocinitomicaceae bacterium]|nr:hypothetical protein [Flavobacteriales bacterium]NQZ38070.1 hypothetical protein [Crocinitomicaceae bacterium]